MVKGYAGKILRVDLTNDEIWTEEPPDSFYRRYIGGQGFVAYYLLKEMPKGTDPLGPDNVLIFATGTFTGIPVAGSGRNAVGAKSPLTGGYGEADVGGFFGAELKHAGYDAIVVQGKASKPVYLWVHDDEAEIRPAGHLWGMTTLDCQKTIREELQDSHVRLAMIGPGGEKMVRYACVINDLKHAAGRTGMGAVMGAKNLKAVAARGSAKVPVADEGQVRELGKWMRDHWEEMMGRLHDLGSAGNVLFLNQMGVLPTRNFREGQFEGADRISGEAMKDTILVGREGCYACPVRCKRVVEVNDDEYQISRAYGGPEYETVAAFGSNCGVDDLKAIAKAHELCNAYGLDTISTGGMVAFAMECFEEGLLTTEDTGGLELRFGNAKAMVELTRQICKREGFGDILAEGPRYANAKIAPGSDKLSMDVKGQGLPMHEPRARHGLGFGYAVSPTGADHMHNFWDHVIAFEPTSEAAQSLGLFESVSQTELNPQKVRAYTYWTNWAWLHNHLGNCMYVRWTRDQIVSLIRAITGWQTNMWELMKVGERSTTMSRVFNMREGLARSDDVLPERMAVSVGNHPGIAPEVVDASLTTFYGMMGWDSQTGLPTLAKLQELDIEWVAEHLS